MQARPEQESHRVRLSELVAALSLHHDPA